MKTTDITRLRFSSIDVIRANQAETGAYIASPNFRVYNYSWFRDGAFIADAMLEVGEIESARLFHKWASNVILDRSSKIMDLVSRKKQNLSVEPQDHLHCRYTTDGNEGLEDWTNFQLDGFGTWLWSVSRFCAATSQSGIQLITAIEITSRYLIAFWDSPSYDWWEESFGYLHVSSIGAIAAGLRAVLDQNLVDDSLRLELSRTVSEIIRTIESRGINSSGSLRKWLDEDGLDASSTSLIAPLGLFDSNSSIAKSTVDEVSMTLGTYGTHRHLRDVYYGGGAWPLLSGFLGLALVEMGRPQEAKEILAWFGDQADEQLYLPEQLAEKLLFPGEKQKWILKWGEPANPLLWSHAMYLKLLAATEKLDRTSIA